MAWSRLHGTSWQHDKAQSRGCTERVPGLAASPPAAEGRAARKAAAHVPAVQVSTVQHLEAHNGIRERVCWVRAHQQHLPGMRGQGQERAEHAGECHGSANQAAPTSFSPPHLHNVLAVLHNAPELGLLVLVGQLQVGAERWQLGTIRPGQHGVTRKRSTQSCGAGAPRREASPAQAGRAAPLAARRRQTTAPQRWPRCPQTPPACSRRCPGRQTPQTLRQMKGKMCAQVGHRWAMQREGERPGKQRPPRPRRPKAGQAWPMACYGRSAQRSGPWPGSHAHP